jgi:hypothetical protein
MNSVASVFGGSDTGEPVAETVFDSASVKRGRGRPRKVEADPANVEEVKNPVLAGSVSDILKATVTEVPQTKPSAFQSLVEYKLIHDSKPDELVNKVNVLLKQGWVVQGGPLVTPNGLFVQSLTKIT